MNAPLGSWRDAPDDAVLLAYANGDEEAARVLSLRLVPRVLAQATRMLADQAEAEDVAQEAMMKLWEIAADWRQGEAQVSTWLYRVVANLCTDRLRKRRGVSLDQIAEPTDPQMSATAQMQETSRLTALANALAQLPDRQAQAVSLRHLEGLTNPEIAQIMDISVRSVESLTARGKKALADILAGRKAELGYEDDEI
ncbi:MAG: RNA polymerase sigma factor [Loktanella sp.]|jgi:RNA polymerase sigma factor (sigma-70 family)|nr:RNA polymerase sigma factor [Loktanella sp.]MDO7608809.1 RNA polymerase sigma factor [Loktanella sp.]MDO7624215.1 RNA polymerase sigma factor [Loktanella sp.]MDO7625821.1 RNA polymerase sigma factor [Loktanella sp.]MDO7629705.1 RNA polymerase sigma factor [Loktanella sp.]